MPDMANGGNGDPIPFTIDGLKQYSDEWSLKSDLQLLSTVKTMSGALFERTEKLVDMIDNLAHETGDKSGKVSNVINDLQMLASHQFVENRVYEEDGDETVAIEEQAIPRPVDMVERITNYIRSGLKLVDKQFKDMPRRPEQVDDSDDEDTLDSDVQSVMIHNKYTRRRLPPIAGSQQFTKRNFVNLLYDDDQADEFDGSILAAVTSDTPPIDQSNEAQEASYYDDRQEPTDIIFSDSDDSDDFFKPRNQSNIVPGSLMPHPPPPPLFSQPQKAPDLFDDTTGQKSPHEIVASLPQKPPVIDTKTLSFKDELSRRLTNGIVPPDARVLPAETTSSDARQQVLTSSSDTLTPDTSKTSSVSIVNSSRVSVQAQTRPPDRQSQDKQKPAKPSNHGFDFFDDDDEDDETFDIFAKPVTRKTASAARQQPQLPQILDSSSDEENLLKVTVASPRKPATSNGNILSPAQVTAHVSVAPVVLKQDPKDRLRPLPAAAEKESTSSLPANRKDKQELIFSTESSEGNKKKPSLTLFEAESDSDDDLFSQTALDKKKAARQSFKSEETRDSVSRESYRISSQVKEEIKSSPVDPILKTNSPSSEEVKLKRTPLFGESDSGDEQEVPIMDRKSFASRLENTILGVGPQKKKPVGGISIFKGVPAKNTTPEVEQPEKEETADNEPEPQPEVSKPVEEKVVESTSQNESPKSKVKLLEDSEGEEHTDIPKPNLAKQTSTVQKETSGSAENVEPDPSKENVTTEKVTEPSTSFHTSDVGVQLLASHNIKTRPKIQTARRRPTRAARGGQSVITLNDPELSHVPLKSESDERQPHTSDPLVAGNAGEVTSVKEQALKSEVTNDPLPQRATSSTTDDTHKKKEAAANGTASDGNKLPEETHKPGVKTWIFSDSEDDPDDIFTSKTTQPSKSAAALSKKPTLFPDSSDEEQVSVQGKKQPATTPAMVKENPVKPPQPKKTSLFSDDDDDDLFAPKSKS